MVSNVSSKMPSRRCSPCSSMRPFGPRLLAPLPPSLHPRWYTVMSWTLSRQRPSDSSRAAESAAIPPPRTTTRGSLPDPPSTIEKITSVEDPRTLGVGRQQVVHAAQQAAPVCGPGLDGKSCQVVGGAKRQHQGALLEPDLDGGTQILHHVAHPVGVDQSRELGTQAQQ